MRVTYATDDSVKFVGHLDLARAWERAIRRARLPLAYSQGFHPQPRIQFAAALPVGTTGSAEVMDIYLTEDVAAEMVLLRLAAALPRGILASAAEEAPLEWPSLQSQLRGAAYHVEVETDQTPAAFTAVLEHFLVRTEAWRERRRGREMSRYDLRPLVQALEYRSPCERGQAFVVRMRSEPGATGRADELVAELGFERAPRRICRTRLLFAADSVPPGADG